MKQCPKCGRFGVEYSPADKVYKCLWDKCGWDSTQKIKKPKVNKYPKFKAVVSKLTMKNGNAEGNKVIGIKTGK